MAPPLFSIITVARNASTTLAPTLGSVKGQTFTDYEYIFIDGASTDGTVNLVDGAGIGRLRLISEPDAGIYDAMNKGLGMATGDYVIFLNAGDSFHSPDTLALMARAAATTPDKEQPGIIYGQTQLVDTARQRVADRHLRAPERLTLKSFSRGMVVCHQAFAPLRKLTSTFDTRYRFSADYDWCIRCLQHSRRNVYVDAVLIDYLNEGITTANHRASLRERFGIMVRYYGLFPTLARHISFAIRYLRRRLANKNLRQ